MKTILFFLLFIFVFNLGDAKKDGNSRFKLCCARQKAADQTCKRRFCDFNVLSSDNILLFLNLCSPKGHTVRDLWKCATSDMDHTDCCKKKNVIKECLPYCSYQKAPNDYLKHLLCEMSQKAPYLPECWSDEHEMAGLMSHLKLRHVNPKNYDRIVDFWWNLIDDYCRHEKKCLLSFDELKNRFKRGNQLPAPLATVLEEMYNKQVIVPADELSSPRQGWLQWGASFLAKSSWLTGAKVDFHKVQFVHVPTLKAQAKELLEFYKVEYEMVDCPEVVGYDEFKQRCRNICKADTFDLVLDELMRQGEVSIGTSEIGERLLKFKDQTSRGPAKFTRADASVHELRRMMSKVDSELRRIEQRVRKFDQEARDAVHRKDKTAALQALRKKKRAEKEMTDKDVQYQRLVGMLEQLASSKQSREILDAYKAGTRAYKEALERQGLTLDKVDETMDSGFSSIPMPNAHIEDSALEDELNAIMAEEGAEKTPKGAAKKPAGLFDLPEVPADRISDDEVADRVRRLRQGLSA
ncbi:hypothetical protein M3Y99_00179300 [Aphelenchoides fujianensis]|nr:hypothetical protein M3Y99_00179300 [Aphelenchoides fujianensis]